MLALEFPSIDNLVEWPAYFKDAPLIGDGEIFMFNKIGMISLLAVLIPFCIFFFSKKELVPAGLQHVSEGIVGFVETQIIDATMGPAGRKYLPLLLSLFLFVFMGNIFEIIPTFQMPANARMANPLFLALLVWAVYIVVGIKHNGFGKYIKASLLPSGVPLWMAPLIIAIEFISVFILRPFSLTIRLFANMLAGHILLVTFGVLSIALFELFFLASILPFSFLVLLTGYEAVVSLLQAFIFTLLTAVYIDSSINIDH